MNRSAADSEMRRITHAVASHHLDGGLDRRRFIRGAGGLMLVTSLGGVIAACGGGGGDDGRNAGGSSKVGGTLTMLAWSGYDDRTVSAPFRARDHVTVNSSPLNANEEILTKLKAGGLGSIDLATPNIAYAASLHGAQVAAPIDYERIPNTADYLPQIRAAADANATFGGSKYAAPFVWGYDALNYNATQLTDPPRSWKDLTDASFKKKLLLVDSATANFWIWPRVLGFDPETLTKDQLDQTTEYLIELKRTQVRTITGNQDDIVAQLSSGDALATASGSWSAIPYFAKRKGAAKVESTIPAEGGYTWIDSWAIAKDAPNADTAYAWIDYMLAAKQQATLADNLASATVNAKAVKHVSKQFRALYPYNSPDLSSANVPNVGFPKQDANYVNIQDMSEAWGRVTAA